MIMEKTYNIVCVADESYAQHAAVMLASLIDHNKEKNFHVFLLTTGMSADTMERLRSVLNSHGVITFCQAGDHLKELKGLRTATEHKTWNSIMYLKLLIPQFLTQDVERLMFLDVDMVVCSDITEVYELSLGDNVVAACDDYKFQQASRDLLKLHPSEQYINSGMMVIDLDAWRTIEETKPMADFISEYRHLLRNDQDGIALYFRGKIQLVPNRWNATTFYFEQLPRVLDKYLSEVDEIRHNPAIVHFCEPVKPWFRDCHHPYRHLYRHYLALTPWHEYTFPYYVNPYTLKFWKEELKYWLNRWGIRREPMCLVKP